MIDIHEQTIEAWVRDDPDFDPEASLEDLAEAAPEPEKKGEVSALLRGTGLSSDWLDGYLTGIVIAPKIIMPNQWLPRILDAVLPRIDPSRFQRFMDLLMMRAQAVAEIASEPAEFAASISNRSKKGQRDWASGFSEALDRFRSAWPQKGMTKEDSRLIEIGVAGLAGADLPALAALIAKRQEKNSG